MCVTRDRIAERLTELSGNPKVVPRPPLLPTPLHPLLTCVHFFVPCKKVHEQKLGTLMNMDGVASLQNAIELSIKILKNIPEYVAFPRPAPYTAPCPTTHTFCCSLH